MEVEHLAENIRDFDFLKPLITSIGIQKAIPAIAKNPVLMSKIESLVGKIQTHHKLILGDSRDLSDIPDDSIHLIVTSPPYWNLKKYHESSGQMGNISDYEEFVSELDKVWNECHRVLVKGGRLVVVVGDVCISRKQGRQAFCYATACKHNRRLPEDRI